MAEATCSSAFLCSSEDRLISLLAEAICSLAALSWVDPLATCMELSLSWVNAPRPDKANRQDNPVMGILALRGGKR
jgi:hypothetical protein